MSLTAQQKVDAIDEFARAMKELGVSFEEAARDLGTTSAYVKDVAHLRSHAIEHPWILRNYLLAYAERTGASAPRFFMLSGDYHRYWFLDAALIDRGLLS